MPFKTTDCNPPTEPVGNTLVWDSFSPSILKRHRELDKIYVFLEIVLVCTKNLKIPFNSPLIVRDLYEYSNRPHRLPSM
jgi:hypothetical protein